MDKTQAEQITAIVWGDRDRPTSSWLSRQYEALDDAITSDSNKIGIRYTGRVVESELRHAGFTPDAIKKIRETLVAETGTVYAHLGRQRVDKHLPNSTLGKLFGVKNGKLFQEYDFSNPKCRTALFARVRQNFTEALTHKDIQFPPEGLQRTAAAPALSLRQKFYKAAACLTPAAVGTGLAAALALNPVPIDLQGIEDPSSLFMGLIIKMGIQYGPAAAIAGFGLVLSMRGGFASSVGTARARMSPRHARHTSPIKFL